MGGASSFEAMMMILGFFAAVWTASKGSQIAGISSIVFEISVGVILGPKLIELIPHEYGSCSYERVDCQLPIDWENRINMSIPMSRFLDEAAKVDNCDPAAYHDHHALSESDLEFEAVEEEAGTVADYILSGEEGRRLAGGGNYDNYTECLVGECLYKTDYQCGLTPDVFTLVGHFGVAMMIFESGMHFSFDSLSVVGARACIVAVLGTFLPLVSGLGLIVLQGGSYFEGLAVGVALAPTSVGIALRLLIEAQALELEFGQAIITAAFVDDILSLVLFNMLFAISPGSEFDVMTVVVNPLLGIAFMIGTGILAVAFFPWFVQKKMTPWLNERRHPSIGKVPFFEEGMFFLMLLLFVVYSSITHILGTHLWGAFMAGMSFSAIDEKGFEGHAHHVWVRQTKRYTSWMIRSFFACTVAFSIPVWSLFSWPIFVQGTIMGLGPCILSKVVCAFFMKKQAWVIGWAMVGRAEFAYLIAQTSLSAKLISEDTYAICIWALLYATIIAPFAFRYVLQSFMEELKQDEDMMDTMTMATGKSTGTSFYRQPENYRSATIRDAYEVSIEMAKQLEESRTETALTRSSAPDLGRL